MLTPWKTSRATRKSVFIAHILIRDLRGLNGFYFCVMHYLLKLVTVTNSNRILGNTERLEVHLHRCGVEAWIGILTGRERIFLRNFIDGVREILDVELQANPRSIAVPKKIRPHR